MDALVQEPSHGDTSAILSYDEGLTYEEQVAALPAALPQPGSSALASRISANKIYLPPESMLKGKRKRGDETYEAMDEDEDMYEVGDGVRRNALYLHGSPIAHLPTNNIFAYARHFNLEPVGLEWIDDSSCVLIFPSNAACRTALEVFRKGPSEEPDVDDCVSAKSVPVILWPAEDRINKTLGVADGMEGPLSVRIARTTDRKARGAKFHSAFYQKHGMDAGKDPNAHAIGRAPENGSASRRGHDPLDDDEKRRQLDEELDQFLLEGDEDRTASVPPSPPSKMRSDYMTENGRGIRGIPGRSLLERTSMSSADFDDDESTRLSSRRRRRGVRGQGRKGINDDASLLPASRRRRLENGGSHVRHTNRPQKTLQELDDELDAFLNNKD